LTEQNKKPTDAEEIFSEFQNSQKSKTSEQDDSNIDSPDAEFQESNTERNDVSSHESMQEPTSESSTEVDKEETHYVIFVGTKPILTYVTATLTQLANQPVVTIKARGKRITQAVDVSQMIVKRMNTVGYIINDVRIASDLLQSQDGKNRNVSSIEIDITTQ